MPELPEVDRAATRLRRVAVGRTIDRIVLHHPALRRRVTATRLRTLRGRQIASVVRRGKHQRLELEDGRVIHVHFRMAGDWEIGREEDAPERHARATISLSCASEALWRARIDPRAVASRLDAGAVQCLLDAIRAVLGPAGRLPGRYRDATGSRRIAVYGRHGKPCRRGDGTIRRIVQAGRSTFYCPGCQ